MKWPRPWKLVTELERKLKENQDLAKRVAKDSLEDNELKKEMKESARRYKPTCQTKWSS